ncbi:MAG: kelch repeat-containing protein [candidate division WOR-3 bacterium]
MRPKSKGLVALALLAIASLCLAVSGPMTVSPPLPVPHYHWAPTEFHATPCYNPDCHEEHVWMPGGGADEVRPGVGGVDGQWVAVPAPTTQPDRMCSANCYDEVHDMLYMIGGDPAGYYGVNNCQRFNPVTNVWTDLQPMPGARTWLDGEGAICQRLGKIYIFGGYTGSANNQTYEYTISTNSWTTKASMTSATLAYPSGIWRDSLMYVFGGAGPSLSGSNVVQVYNPFNNTWATATSLPEACDMGSGTIIGDTIYITNGYNRTSGALWANARKGYINPSNPLQITWSNWTLVPTYGFNGGTTRLNGWVYRLGGFGTLYVGSDHVRGWRYNPANPGTYETLPWPPNPPYRRGLARCNFLNRREAGNELFIFAGDEYGDWSTPNRYYFRNQFTPPHDVGVSKILEPATSLVFTGDSFLPTIEVKNYGLNPETDVPVTFQVESAGTVVYSAAALVSLGIGETETLYFTDYWYVGGPLWTGYMVKAWTALTTDVIPQNDTASRMCLVSTDTIISPSGATPPSIDGYLNFAGGEWSDANFANLSNVSGWGASPPVPHGPDAAYAWFKHDGSYLYLAFAFPEGMTRDIGDQIGFYLDEDGDGEWEPDMTEGNYWIWVNGSSADEVLFRWHRPDTFGPQGLPVPGAQSASGTFNGYLTFEVKLPFGTLPYQVNMNPANDTGKLFIYMMDNGQIMGWWPVAMAEDSWRSPQFYGTYILQTLQSGDVGVTGIPVPGSVVAPGATITPTGTWKNFGTTTMNFTAYYFLDSAGTRVYSQSQPATLAGGGTVNLTFPNYTFANDTSSGWVAKCSTVASGDVNPANNAMAKSFKVSTAPPVLGWKEMKQVPLTPSGKQVKDGGWLSFDPGADGGFIYAAKGNKTPDFYRYHVDGDSWQTLAPIKPGTENKLPKKGCYGCADGAGHVFMTKGNNTLGFWEYFVEGDSWVQLTDVPLGNSGKKVKGGTDMVYVVLNDTGYVYLLKGYKQDFFRWNTVTGQWQTLQDAPAGSNPKWDKGSWLVYDGDQFIYAHKAKYHEFYKYDLATGTWSAPLPKGMPMTGSSGKTKKSKDGGSAAYYDGAIYALKGGNTCEFWCYFVEGDSWKELDPMPEVGSTGKKKRVKAGGDIVSAGNYQFYALKGNKTVEFWCYGGATVASALEPLRQGVMAENLVAQKPGITIVPNPLSNGRAVLRYNLPKAGPVRLVIYDVTGRDVLSSSFVASHSGAATLDLRSLSAGVYLVKLDADGYRTTQKLTVER